MHSYVFDNSVKLWDIKLMSSKPEIPGIDSHYLHCLFDPTRMKEISDWAAKEINKIKDKIKAIAVRGVSGMVMGGIISEKTGIPLTIVRKSHDGSHAQAERYGLRGDTVEGMHEGDYLIIDDFIASGETINRIVNAITLTDYDNIGMVHQNRKCFGVMLYRNEVEPEKEEETRKFIASLLSRHKPVRDNLLMSYDNIKFRVKGKE